MVITIRRYEVGEVIVREHDWGDTAYIIEQGQVEVSKDLDGQQVHLANLGAGDAFGEMSMIDEKPRSATVTAVTETVVREIQRDAFFHSLQTDPDVALTLLKVLFERLREAHTLILQLQKAAPPPTLVPTAPLTVVLPREQVTVMPPTLVPTAPLTVVLPRGQLTVTLEGVTPRAAAALPVTPFPINHFPFRIGRQSPDPLVYNDLMLPDAVPLQISRHHLAFIAHEGRVGVVDRGSTLGSWVDDHQFGGPSGFPGPVFFTGSEGLLVLGSGDSPFRYRVRLRAPGV
jgi:Cyclic nucleotide-binding domain/FHA domain